MNFEFVIRRNIPRLDWAQVHANNMCLGMLVGKIDHPEASSSPKIQNVMLLIRDGGKSKFAVERLVEDFVLQIKSVLFRFVFGKKVLAVTVPMVAWKDRI